MKPSPFWSLLLIATACFVLENDSYPDSPNLFRLGKSVTMHRGELEGPLECRELLYKNKPVALVDDFHQFDSKSLAQRCIVSKQGNYLKEEYDFIVVEKGKLVRFEPVPLPGTPFSVLTFEKNLVAYVATKEKITIHPDGRREGKMFGFVYDLKSKSTKSKTMLGLCTLMPANSDLMVALKKPVLSELNKVHFFGDPNYCDFKEAAASLDGSPTVVQRSTKYAVPEEAVSVEVKVDRPGQDYVVNDLEVADPKICGDACLKDKRCCAYTYVQPNTQGPKARCWLKTAVPPANPNTCCTSGVKNSCK